jgi:hypothetical protein
MKILAVNIANEKDVPELEEILKRYGLTYIVDEKADYGFSDEEIKSLVKTKQDFLDGKTTARNWEDVENDLNRAFD